MSAMFTVTPARCVSKSQFTPGAAQLKAQPARVQSRCAKVAPKRALKVQSMHRLGDTSGMSAEQIEFLKRKHGIIDSDPANAPGALNTHGAGDTREKPQQAAYVPPPAPVAAADPSGFSADQLAFLARKKAGDTEIAGAMNTHGAGDTRGQSAPAPA
ncbi:hypothetical protein CYMTET_8049, partial [Cymbomonas tetramitiformis]